MTFRITLLLILFLFSSCSDLGVENLNEPDSDATLKSEAKLTEELNDTFRIWYNQIHNFIQVGLSSAADANACPPTTEYLRILSNEPRLEWPNRKDISITKDLFNKLYTINSKATDVLHAISEGVEFEKEAMIKAQAKFIQGISLGYIALLFDKGFMYDEFNQKTDVLSPELLKYDEIASHAIQKLEEASTLAKKNSFVLPDDFFNATKSITNEDFYKITNTFAARILAYLPRNKSTNETIDWEKVRNLALEGMDFDLFINTNLLQGSGRDWRNIGFYFLATDSFGEVDHRIVNMLDTQYPKHLPSGKTQPKPDPKSPTLIDQRLLTDLEHHIYIYFFDPCQYYYHSNFYFSGRYDIYEDEAFPEILQAENDLLLAEAYLNLGPNYYNEAASLINSGTRITRGKMDPISSTEQEIRDAIHHERMIELYATGTGIQFFEMRKNDLLQEGTLLHFPLPKSIIQKHPAKISTYTFGGEKKADGINTSISGWRSN